MALMRAKLLSFKPLLTRSTKVQNVPHLVTMT